MFAEKYVYKRRGMVIPMQYKELVFQVGTSQVSEAEAIISLLDIGGIYTEDYSDMDDCPLVRNFALIDEELLKKDKTSALLHVYFGEHADIPANLEFISARFAACGIPVNLLENTVREEDYAESWKQYYKPLKIGKITVVPEWETYTPSENETILRIDPGMAFGTGNHETTSLCVEALQQYFIPGGTLVDLGCGSGILSITALLLGAEKAVGIDIDPNAVKVSGENAALNIFPGTFTGIAGNILEEKTALVEGEKFDCIAANIVADVILRFLPFAQELLREKGKMILSGIITERGDEVKQALEANGFSLLEVREKKGWLCIVAGR